MYRPGGAVHRPGGAVYRPACGSRDLTSGITRDKTHLVVVFYLPSVNKKYLHFRLLYASHRSLGGGRGQAGSTIKPDQP